MSVSLGATFPERDGLAQALDLVRETGSRYRCLVEDSLTGIYIHQDEKYVYVNPKFAEIFGYTPEEMLALDSALEVVLEEDRPRARENIRRRLDGETRGVSYFLRGVRKDGAVIDLEVHGSSIDYNGRPAAIGTVLDRTERSRAEQALRESEARFRALAGAASAAIFIYQGTHLCYVNRSAERLLGYSQDELFAMDVWDVARPEFRAMARDRSLARQRGEPVPTRYEMKILTKSGEERWIDVSAATFSLDGRAAVVGTAVDITARKQAEDALRRSEELYRLIVDTANEGMWITDGGGRIEFLNRRMAEMFGYPREEMIGCPVSDFMEDEVRSDAARRIARCHEGDIQKFDFPFRRSDGSRLWAFVSCRPIRGADGRFDRALAMLVDITGRKLAEDGLKSRERLLRALLSRLESVREEERSRIAREIHDELGQTLTALRMELSRLRSLSRKRRNGLSQGAEETIESMQVLLDGTMETVRRLATDLRPVILDSFGLNAALRWQVREFSKRTGIPCTFDSDLPEIGLDGARSTAVFRIFQEALTNVARHSKASAVAVTLAGRDANLELVVEDDGTGLPPERVSDATSLGLLGMRERALSLGGTVAFGQASSRGTRIEVRIPLPDSASPAAESA